MGAYELLFTLEVEHGYFPGGVCKGLQLAPSADTRRLLERSGCLLRTTDRGLVVAFDSTSRNALAMRVANADEPFVFHFLGHGADASFANYTEGPVGSQDLLLTFDSRSAHHDEANTRWTMQPAPLKLDTASAAGMLSQAERRAPPHFAASVAIGPRELNETRHYLCRLQARATVWKYCLIGELAEDTEPLLVVDLGQAHRFDAAVDERLPDGRAMRALRSSAPIVLQERSAQRFQLRRQGTGADKVLIKRLPVASPAQLNRETLGGVPTWVSEIYVHHR